MVQERRSSSSESQEPQTAERLRSERWEFVALLDFHLKPPDYISQWMEKHTIGHFTHCYWDCQKNISPSKKYSRPKEIVEVNILEFHIKEEIHTLPDNRGLWYCVFTHNNNKLLVQCLPTWPEESKYSRGPRTKHFTQQI